MMNVGKYALAVMGFALVAAVAQAGVTVTNVVVQQRWPWNGLVDIDYEVLCDNTNSDVYVYPTAVDHDTNLSISPRTLTGEGASGPVKAGKRRMTWNMTADQPTLHSSALSVTISAFSSAYPYLVIDLSDGPGVAAYPVRYSAAAPDIGNDACRTSNLWLRLVLPGTFMMGSPTDELGRQQNGGIDSRLVETLHNVTLTTPYYISLFEVTQKQWVLVMGSNPSGHQGDIRPVEQVSYNMIRGTVNGAAWPANGQVDADSFLGKLRARTAVTFDLPTEAQWEYACRAGTSTALNSGMNLTNITRDASMAVVGRYYYNQSDGKGGYSAQHTKVGSYLPNAWGLYDMHGNVQEWCLDWSGGYSGNVTDPKGSTINKDARITRGGGWSYSNYGYFDAQRCRSAYRNHNGPDGAYDSWGFRVIAIPIVQ